MKPTSTRRSLRLVLVTAALFVSAAGVVLAATAPAGSESTVIQACKLNLVGALRVVQAATDCNSKLETPLSWNNQGPAGPPGLAGPQGLRGEKGDTGAAGPAGAVSLATLAGSPCQDHVGSAGTITISATATDDIVLHCSAAGGSSGGESPVHLLALTFQRYDTMHYTVTVTLTGPASQETTVALSSSDVTNVVVPAAITVPVGRTSAGADGAATLVGGAGAEITASLGGESIHATLIPS